MRNSKSRMPANRYYWLIKFLPLPWPRSRRTHATNDNDKVRKEFTKYSFSPAPHVFVKGLFTNNVMVSIPIPNNINRLSLSLHFLRDRSGINVTTMGDYEGVNFHTTSKVSIKLICTSFIIDFCNS